MAYRVTSAATLAMDPSAFPTYTVSAEPELRLHDACCRAHEKDFAQLGMTMTIKTKSLKASFRIVAESLVHLQSVEPNL